MRERIGKAIVWEANYAPSKPICIAGSKKNGFARDGLIVEVYFNKKGKLRGVLVYDGDTEEVVMEYGKIPEEVL